VGPTPQDQSPRDRPEDAALAAAYVECAATVRGADSDLWVASLFWPDRARPHAHALLAFFLELARIREIVSNPMLGEIRLQWWADTLEAEAPAGHPIAIALIDTIRRFNLDKVALAAAIEAYRFDLYDDPMPTEAALDTYLDETVGTLFASIARVLAPGRVATPCAASAARAFGLTKLLRRLPDHVRRGQLFIPLDLLQKFRLPPDHIVAGQASPALSQVLTAMRARIRRDLEAMRAGLPAAGPGGAAALPAFLCPAYLKRMEAPGLNQLATPVEIAPLRRLWILWRAARRLA
jgi:phytoene synthase